MKQLSNLLVFDTATDITHLGLMHAGVSHCTTLPGGAQASVLLIQACLDALAQAGLRLQDLDAIAFGSGPGSFTGLRTACAVAQGLAFGAQIPVLAVPTLMAVAYDAHQRLGHTRVLAATDARMGEVYAANYEFSSNKFNEYADTQAISPEKLVLGTAQALAGNAHLAYAHALPADCLAVAVNAAPTGPALLAAAQQLWGEGRATKPEHARPLYVRNKVAKTEAERAAEKAGLAT